MGVETVVTKMEEKGEAFGFLDNVLWIRSSPVVVPTLTIEEKEESPTIYMKSKIETHDGAGKSKLLNLHVFLSQFFLIISLKEMLKKT